MIPADANSPLLPPHAAGGGGPGGGRRRRVGFGEDFRRFFLRGAAALLPTLITLWLIVWVWELLWESLGQHIITAIKRTWLFLGDQGFLPREPAAYIGRYWDDDLLRTKVVGVLLAVILVYILGVFVGNLIGRTMWRLAETAVMKIPFVRAIYPAVKQVTDFLITPRGAGQFQASRVVAVQPHANDIWSLGLVTGAGLPQLSAGSGEDMVTVFCPSTPTAFSGYVLVVPRSRIVELPLTVEEAMRLLVSGGVLTPGAAATASLPASAAPAHPTLPPPGPADEVVSPARLEPSGAGARVA